MNLLISNAFCCARLLLAAGIAVLWVQGADAEASQIPGTRVILDVPADFIPSTSFAGFEHEKLNAGIMVTEIPSSYLEFSRLYDSDNLTKGDMKVIHRERQDKDGLSGQLIALEHDQDGKIYERWILITGDTKESVRIAGYFPQKHASRFRDDIRESLAESFWDSAKILDHFSGLGFRVEDVPSLRIATRMNNNLVFTESGGLPDQYYTDALMIMSLQRVDTSGSLEQSFAEKQFANITLVVDPIIDKVQSQQLKGLDSITLEGIGKHRHLGYNVAVIQVIARTEIGILMAQGFTTLDKRTNDFDIFKTTIGTFRLEDN